MLDKRSHTELEMATLGRFRGSSKESRLFRGHAKVKTKPKQLEGSLCSLIFANFTQTRVTWEVN